MLFSICIDAARALIDFPLSEKAQSSNANIFRFCLKVFIRLSRSELGCGILFEAGPSVSVQPSSQHSTGRFAVYF
jgi:hypothetical protein